MIRLRLQFTELVVAAALCVAQVRAQTGCPGCGSAAEFDVRAHLELVAPDGCGTQAELRERVRRRSERVRFVEPGPGVRRARAELRVSPDRSLHATLIWWSDDGRELVRELRARDCADALDALALVLAVTLSPDADPGATTGPGNGSSGQGGKTAPPQTEASSPSSEPAALTSRTDETPSSRSNSSPSSDDRADRAERADRDGAASGVGWALRPFAGISVGTRFGPAPLTLPGFGGFVGLVTPGVPDSGLIRLNLSRHARSGFAAEGGNAEFELDSLRLDLCPLGTADARIAVYGCVSGEFGVLAAGGSSTRSARSVERPWRSFSAGLLLALRPVPFTELELLGALEHPLVRDRFQFVPRVFHEVPPITARLELGLGVRIP